MLVGAADALAQLLDGTAIAQRLDEIRGLETAADDITRDVLTAVRRSFITPFDRSAITSLISSMDDAVDEIWHTAKTVRIYRVTAFEPQVRRIRRPRARSRAAGPGSDSADAQHRPQRGAPARNHRSHRPSRRPRRRAPRRRPCRALRPTRRAERPIAFFVGRELYRFVERVLDRFQDIADEIQGIVIDHA